jgi:hypothetical protein
MKLGKLILRSDGNMEVENIEVQPEELEGLQKILVLAENWKSEADYENEAREKFTSSDLIQILKSIDE